VEFFCWRIDGILFHLEPDEKKNKPASSTSQEHNEMGNKVGLLLRLIHTIWGEVEF
jgi:hypothetical protein